MLCRRRGVERLDRREAGDTGEHLAGSGSAGVMLGAQDFFKEIKTLSSILPRRRALLLEMRVKTETLIPVQGLGSRYMSQSARRAQRSPPANRLLWI
jgi:hypothetical protein